MYLICSNLDSCKAGPKKVTFYFMDKDLGFLLLPNWYNRKSTNLVPGSLFYPTMKCICYLHWDQPRDAPQDEAGWKETH